MTGVATSNLPTSTTVDDVLGNSGGNTRRIPIDRLVALITALMGPTYALRSQLFADLGWPAGSIGYVRADGTTAFNGVYKKSGNSGGGSWSRIGDLPTSAVEAAIINDLTAEIRTRRIASTANANFSGTTFPPGTTTVLFRTSAAFAVWRLVEGSAPNPPTAIHQQDATGTWWERVWQSADIEGRADQITAAVRVAGVIALVGIGGTGDAIVGSLDPIGGLGATLVANTMLLAYRPSLPNMASNPTITIGGTTFGVRAADGSNWPALAFVAGGPQYVLARFGAVLRVINESSRADLATERSNRITGIAQAGTIQLEGVGGTANAIIAAVPTTLKNTGISAANIRRANFTALADNTGSVTIDIDGVGPVSVRSATGAQLSAGRIKGGRITAIVKVGSNWQLTNDALDADVTALQARATAVETTIGTAVRQVLIQLGAALPVRPLPKAQGLFEWEVFDPLPPYPAGPQGPYDTQRIIASSEPDVPTDDSWDFRNAGDGTNGVIRIFDVPQQRPRLDAVQYSIDDGAFAALPLVGGLPVPGDYLVPAAAGERSAAIRHANFRGPGVPTLSRSRQIVAGPVTFAMPPAGFRLHTGLPNDWRLIYQDGNAGTRGLQENTGMLRPSHDNSATRCMSLEYFPTNQWIDGEIEQLFASLAVPQMQGVGFGVNCSRDGNVGFMALFQTGGVWLFAATGPNSYSSALASAALTIAPTPSERTQIRVAREGNLLRVRVNGTWVLEHLLTGSHLATVGGSPQVYGKTPNTTDSRLQTRFKMLTAGRG